jgi:hypothetical protein
LLATLVIGVVWVTHMLIHMFKIFLVDFGTTSLVYINIIYNTLEHHRN